MKLLTFILLFFTITATAQNKAVLRIAGADTGSLSSRINSKVNISDTAAMLSPYARLINVPAQFNPIAGNNITLSGSYPNITFNAIGGLVADSVILNRSIFQNKQFNVRVGTADTLTANRASIGTATPAASALLDLTSTSRGLLLPRMTTTQRNAITAPAVGLKVYNTTDSATNVYDGAAWQFVGGKRNVGYISNVITANTNVATLGAFDTVPASVLSITDNNFNASGHYIVRIPGDYQVNGLLTIGSMNDGGRIIFGIQVSNTSGVFAAYIPISASGIRLLSRSGSPANNFVMGVSGATVIKGLQPGQLLRMIHFIDGGATTPQYLTLNSPDYIHFSAYKIN